MRHKEDTTARPRELAGVKEKLDRADHHLNTLHDEVRRFIDTKRDSIVGDFESERSSYVFWLQDLEQPPLRWGVVMGEAVHNFRSALDHLAWQLIRRDRKPRGNPGYPICCEEPSGGFCAWAHGSSNHPGPLFGAGSEAIARIERTQPYNGGDRRLLLVLNRLWAADKHRFLLPRYISINPLEVWTGRYVPNADAGNTLSIQVGSGEKAERGTELVVVGLTPSGDNPQVTMEGNPPIAVTFSGGQGIVESLDEVGTFIRASVLRPLQELFL